MIVSYFSYIYIYISHVYFNLVPRMTRSRLIEGTGKAFLPTKLSQFNSNSAVHRLFNLLPLGGRCTAVIITNAKAFRR